MLDDDKLKDLFNQSSLENEDWLEPSGDVFAGISEELFCGGEGVEQILDVFHCVASISRCNRLRIFDSTRF